MSGRRSDARSRLVVAALVAAELAALSGLVVHSYFESRRLQVDTTSVALLIFILLAPSVPRLKIFEFAGVKAELTEADSRNVATVVEVLKRQQAAISEIYRGYVGEAADSPEVTQASEVSPESTVPASSARPLERVLWVDDHPENNLYEMDALSRVVRITAVKTNDDALRELSTGDYDALISDVSRDGDASDEPGGLRLLRTVRSRQDLADLPVFFYTGERSATRNAALFAEMNARVSTEFRSLVRELRAEAVKSELAIIVQAAAQVGADWQMDTRGLDLVLIMPNGRRIGIELASWLTRPQMAAFTQRVERLEEARSLNEIDEGWLLVRRPTIDARRESEALGRDIRLVTISDIARILAAAGR